MKKSPKQSLILTLTWLILFSGDFMKANTETVKAENLSIALNKAKELKFEQPDTALYQFNFIHKMAMATADTTMAVKALMELASMFGHQANYKASYDHLWKALLLADANKNDLTKSSIYKALGRYYSFFNREEKAISFLRLALEIKKQYIEQNQLEEALLVDNYHAFIATFRELDQAKLAQEYLDTAFFYHRPDISYTHLSFLKFEQAVLYNVNKQPSKALTIFKEILPWFKANRVNYQVLVYSYIGDSYKLLGAPEKSQDAYQTALTISKIHNCHIDFTPLVYEKLYQLNYDQGNYQQAVEFLQKSKSLDALFFDSRSQKNLPLLEIQDAFRQEKEQQNTLLQKQRVAQLEQEEKVSFLEKIILIGLIGFLLLFGILYFNYVRNKHKIEKQLIQRKQELENQKTNELVELKNKELAVFALKLIEKETFIDLVKEKLSKDKGDVKRTELEQIVRSASTNNSESWQEFEARFVSINKSFYKKLTNRFPTLTQGDLKLCALVKLNFSSKEMAKLTGISVDSMHTTRSRLRKKLQLEKGKNLKEFIANV